MTALLHDIPAVWWQWTTQVSEQAVIVFVTVLLFDRLLSRRAWPQLLSLLWLLVMVKLVLPPSLSSPLSIAHIVPESRGTAAVVSAPAELVTSPLVPIAMSMWLVGVIGVAATMYLRRRRAMRALLGDASPAPHWLDAHVRVLADRIGLSRIPEIRISRRPAGPAVLGIWRPVIVLPGEFLVSNDPERTDHVLLHELAHVKRRDPLVACAIAAVQVLYWFHPIAWLARRRLDVLREVCCDQHVRRAIADDAPGYRRTLLHFARPLVAPAAAPSMALIHPQSQIIARLRWLDRPVTRPNWTRRVLSSLVAGALAVSVLPLAGPTTRPIAHATTDAAPAPRPPGCLQLRYQVFRMIAEQELSGANPDSVS